MKKLIYILLAITFIGCSSDDEPCLLEASQTTLPVPDVPFNNDSGKYDIILNGVINLGNCESSLTNTEQGFVISREIQPTLDDIKINVNGNNISTIFPISGNDDRIYYVRTFITNTLGVFYGNEVSFQTTLANPLYLDNNGVTVKA